MSDIKIIRIDAQSSDIAVIRVTEQNGSIRVVQVATDSPIRTIRVHEGIRGEEGLPGAYQPEGTPTTGNLVQFGTDPETQLADSGIDPDNVLLDADIGVTLQAHSAVLDATTASFLTADETKLDGIEAGATADQTAAEILAALLTVDGSGSGLDADTLDGISSAAFALYADIGTTIQAWDADLDSWAGVTRASGFDTFAATPTLANLGSLLTNEAAGTMTFLTTPSMANLGSMLTDDASGWTTFGTTPTSANLGSLVTDDLFLLSDIELGALSGLTSAADKVPYFTGSGTAALADLSSSMRTFMTTPSSANLASLVSDDAFSLADAELGAIAGLTSAADRLPYFTGSGTAALATFTTAGRALVDDADSTAQLTTLGFGGSLTFGAGSGFTWTFDAGATDPIITFATGVISLTACKLGIGATTTPDGSTGALHLFEGSAGTVTANASADNFIMENSGDSGFSALTPDANASHWLFGCPSNNAYAYLRGTYNSAHPIVGLYVLNFEKFRVTDTAIYCVGVGTTASAANAFLDSGSSPANQLLRSTSSIEFKRDVEDLEVEFAEKALELRPVYYRSKAPADNPDWSWYGLIAEEVAATDPRLVHWGYSESDWVNVPIYADDGTLFRNDRQLKPDATKKPQGVMYDRIVPHLIYLLKKQQKEIDELKEILAK